MALAESYGIDRDVAYELLSSPQGVFSPAYFLHLRQDHQGQGILTPWIHRGEWIKGRRAHKCCRQGLQGALLMPLLQQQLELTCSADPSGGKDIDLS